MGEERIFLDKDVVKEAAGRTVNFLKKSKGDKYYDYPEGFAYCVIDNNEKILASGKVGGSGAILAKYLSEEAEKKAIAVVREKRILLNLNHGTIRKEILIRMKLEESIVFLKLVLVLPVF